MNVFAETEDEAVLYGMVSMLGLSKVLCTGTGGHRR